MQNAIKSIIDEIPSGNIFDSHFIINRLIKHHSDQYLIFASKFNSLTDKTLVVHGNIGQEIAKFVPSTLKKLPDLSWSENIHCNSSECACWQKL